MSFRCAGLTQAGVGCRRRVPRRGEVCGVCRPPSHVKPSVPALEVREPPVEPAAVAAAKASSWFAARGGHPVSTDERWWEQWGLEEGPVAGMLSDFDLSHRGWWVWPDSGTGFRRDQYKIADCANARIIDDDRCNGVVGGVVCSDSGSGPAGVGFVGVGRLTGCCPDSPLACSPAQLYNDACECARCGSVLGPEFKVEVPAEEIRLCDDPNVTLTAAPGSDALARKWYGALLEADREASAEACERLSGCVSKLADPGLWQSEEWEWCENPGNPTGEEIEEAAEDALLKAGAESDWCDNYDIHYSRYLLGNENSIGYMVGFYDIHGEWTGSDIWFDRTGPRRKDIDDCLTVLAETQASGNT